MRSLRAYFNRAAAGAGLMRAAKSRPANKPLLLAFAAAVMGLTVACSPQAMPTITIVDGGTHHTGVKADTLDDTPGTVKSAVIYAGDNSIAEIRIGSVRGCFTQMIDAASVNSGNYRIDCIGPEGEIVARFGGKSETSVIYRDRDAANDEMIYERAQIVESKLLPSP